MTENPAIQKDHTQLVADLVRPACDIVATMSAIKANLWHMSTGISTEAGELLGAVKKFAAYDQPINIINIIEEIGDIEFYLEGLRQALRVSREETLTANILKLRKRYPAQKFTTEHSAARLDKIEFPDVDNEVI